VALTRSRLWAVALGANEALLEELRGYHRDFQTSESLTFPSFNRRTLPASFHMHGDEEMEE
jgi:hypothetical protein